MTTKTNDVDENLTPERLERLSENMAQIDALTKRMTAAMAQRKSADPGLQGPGQDLYMKAAAAYMAEMMSNPAKMIEHQVGYWGKSLKHYIAISAIQRGDHQRDG